jgi:hypothetical protein
LKIGHSGKILQDLNWNKKKEACDTCRDSITQNRKRKAMISVNQMVTAKKPKVLKEQNTNTCSSAILSIPLQNRIIVTR